MYERQLRAYGKRYVRSFVHHTAPSSSLALSSPSSSPCRPYNIIKINRKHYLCVNCDMPTAAAAVDCQMLNIIVVVVVVYVSMCVYAILAYISDAAF